MQNERKTWIKKLILNKDNILNVIDEMVSAFPSIFLQYNGYKRSAENFYTTGHCTSFARILSSVFEGQVTIYYSNSHVITKIGDNFFNVLGEVNYEYQNPYDGSSYEILPFEYLEFVEDVLANHSDYDSAIQEDLICIGKNKVNELIEQLEKRHDVRKI